MYARRARERAFISPPRALYLQKIIRARSAEPRRLFSVPRRSGEPPPVKPACPRQS